MATDTAAIRRAALRRINRTRRIYWAPALTWCALLIGAVTALFLYTRLLTAVMDRAYTAGIVAGAQLRDAQTGPLLYRLREIELGHQRQLWMGDSLIGWWPVTPPHTQGEAP